MLMSAVSAQDNITVDDGADLTSDFVEVDSNQGYSENDVSENPVQDDSVSDDDGNVSQGDIKQDIHLNPLDGSAASASYEFNGAAKPGASFNKNIAVHKASSYSRGDSADVRDSEYAVDGMLSNFKSLDDMGVEALNDVLKDIPGEDLFAQTYSSYREYSDYLNLDSLKNFIEENKIEDVFNGNIHIIDYLKYDLIDFIDAGAKYVDFPIADLIDVNAFLDIFDKFMNSPSTHDVMTNIPSSNYNQMLRNHKYYANYSDYGLYQDADSVIDSYDLNDEMELFIDSDGNVSDILIIQDNMALINQTFELNTMSDVCINSYDMESLQLSDGAACWRDAHGNCDKTLEIPSFKFDPQINCLSSDIPEDVQHTFYHMIGCECTSTGFSKQLSSYDNIAKVSEFDTIASDEQEDNHDYVLFKKCNVNSPFIVENTSVFALFGVIKITIP